MLLGKVVKVELFVNHEQTMIAKQDITISFLKSLTGRSLSGVMEVLTSYGYRYGEPSRLSHSYTLYSDKHIPRPHALVVQDTSENLVDSIQIWYDHTDILESTDETDLLIVNDFAPAVQILHEYLQLCRKEGGIRVADVRRRSKLLQSALDESIQKARTT
jgi:hypothetical protein